MELDIATPERPIIRFLLVWMILTTSGVVGEVIGLVF
jgi:hypothetical protein